MFKQTANPFALESLAQALQALPAKLTDAQAQAATDSILAVFKQTTNPLRLSRWRGLRKRSPPSSPTRRPLSFVSCCGRISQSPKD